MTAQIVIPARMASTRLLGKPLADIGGKPLLQRVWERCMEVPEAEGVLILTESGAIVDAAQGWGAAVWLTSGNCWSGTHRIASVADKLTADLIVDVQGDLIGVDPEAVSDLINEAAKRRGDAMSIIIPNEGLNDTGAVKVAWRADGSAVFFSRGIDAAWKEAGIYAYSRSLLVDYWSWANREGPTLLETRENIEQMAFIEYGVAWETRMWRFPMDAVNTPEDLERARSKYGPVATAP